MDQFDRFMERFGVEDFVWWYSGEGFWFRRRHYSDGAWLEGFRCDPIVFWGS
jgi:hypothetical protein